MIYSLINIYNKTNNYNITDNDIPDNDISNINNTKTIDDKNELFLYLVGLICLISFMRATYCMKNICLNQLNKYRTYKLNSELNQYLLLREIEESEESENLNNECSICLERFSPRQITIKLDCNHKFHPHCIIEWFKNELNCPNCRTPVNI